VRSWASLLAALAVLAAFFEATASAQGLSSEVHHATTTPSDARYEIVQSGNGVRWTFRLDRFTGRVDLMVATKDDGLTWQPMPVIGLEPIADARRPRFVVFISGHGARYTLLMDSVAGTTWLLTSGIQVDVAEGETATLDGWVPLPD
jgi:hypothetical protein